MSLGQVPREVGMLVAGHKRVTSYDKCDLSRENIEGVGNGKSNSDSGGKKGVDCSMNAGCGDASIHGVIGGVAADSRVAKAREPSSVHVADFGVASSKDGKKGGLAKQIGGVYVLPYKLGDDIPFDEDVLNHLPTEFAVALGMDVRHVGKSTLPVFPLCTMNNCVVNLYMGKEIVPTEFQK
ncbi:hypothetical protein L7F22_010688 [Adiantum nelumboides]|nr:hypothetical protein [Adiantum nelumboides]